MDRIGIIISSLAISVFVGGAQAASAATLYFYPQNMEIYEGEETAVDIRIDTGGEAINALDVRGGVEGSGIEITSVDLPNTLIDIPIEQVLLENGTFVISGGIPNGFNGSGIIGRVGIRGIKQGDGKIFFSGNSQVISHTLAGQPLPVKLAGALFRVREKTAEYISLSSRSHPDQNTWYKNANLHMNWTLENGAEYSYAISFSPDVTPNEIADRPEGSLEWQGDIEMSGLADGVYYFALKKLHSDGISRYKAMIDTEEPEWVTASVDAGTPETNNTPFVAFLAKDTLSGIDYYEMSIDGGERVKIGAPYQTIEGDYKEITLYAYDKAGNVAGKTIKKNGGDAILYIIIAVGILVGIAAFALKKKGR